MNTFSKHDFICLWQAIRTLRGANFMQRQAAEMQAVGLQMLEEAVSCTPAADLAPAVRALLSSGIAQINPVPTAVKMPVGAAPLATTPGQTSPVKAEKELPKSEKEVPKLVVEEVEAGPSTRVTRAEIANVEDPPTVEGGAGDPDSPEGVGVPVQVTGPASGKKWSVKEIYPPDPDVLYSVQKVPHPKKPGETMKKTTYSCPKGCKTSGFRGDVPIGASKEGVRAHIRRAHTGLVLLCDRGAACKDYSRVSGQAYTSLNAELFVRHATKCGTAECNYMQFGVTAAEGADATTAN